MRGRATPWAALALLGGCTEFADPSTVVDLRVLAVATEPSEVILAENQPIPEIAVTALVADPLGGGRPLSLVARACANDPAAPSAPGTGSEASSNYPAGGARNSVGSARCPADGPASWTLPATATSLPDGLGFSFRLAPAQLLAAFQADVFPGPMGHPHGGFDLGLPLTVDLSINAGGESVAAIKRVLFWRERLREDQRPNQRPTITALRTYPDRDPATLAPVGPVEMVAEDVPRAVLVGQPLWFEPTSPAGEPYLTRVLDRFTDEARLHEVPRETLRYSFFATAGKWVPAETTTELPFGARQPPRIPTESRYHPPAALGEVRVWIVVRDERGGASWITRTLIVR